MASAASTCARAIQPQAIILDVLLPALDGWSLLAELKADPATAAIPVVIVSMMDERGKGFALGAAEYLVKPVGRSQILDALAHCLPHAGRRSHRAGDRRRPGRPRSGRGGAGAGGVLGRAGDGRRGGGSDRARASAPRW